MGSVLSAEVTGGRERLPETQETQVVWLITQRSRGSNPAPATSFRRSGPFPSRERGLLRPGMVVKRVAATALRAARQRDGGAG